MSALRGLESIADRLPGLARQPHEVLGVDGHEPSGLARHQLSGVDRHDLSPVDRFRAVP